MGSRMKLLLILLFIGITGAIFVTRKYKEVNQPKVNFLERKIEEDFFEEEKTEKVLDNREDIKEEESTSIFVHVCGAVKKEGVYEFKSGSRVVTAIEKAGGMTKEADKKGINQAELLVDGSQIYVPFKEDAVFHDIPSSKEGIKTNLNTATKEELMNLPGIGEKKALDIIQYRTTNGRFKDRKDLMKIRGIKENLFNKIKDKITV